MIFIQEVYIRCKGDKSFETLKKIRDPQLPPNNKKKKQRQNSITTAAKDNDNYCHLQKTTLVKKNQQLGVSLVTWPHYRYKNTV